ncbi:unnamed protein product [Closterium sp. NIES-65]|nr:unnamed protein product [Closterium sp. NIES-65]
MTYRPDLPESGGSSANSVSGGGSDTSFTPRTGSDGNGSGNEPTSGGGVGIAPRRPAPSSGGGGGSDIGNDLTSGNGKGFSYRRPAPSSGGNGAGKSDSETSFKKREDLPGSGGGGIGGGGGSFTGRNPTTSPPKPKPRPPISAPKPEPQPSAPPSDTGGNGGGGNGGAKVATTKLYLLSEGSTKGRCLDGSAPGYYHRQGFGTGSRKWIIFLEGGGWCFSLKQCAVRSKGLLGSSNQWPKERKVEFNGVVSPSSRDNPGFYNWNVASIKYCDGGSFAGGSGMARTKANDTVFFLGNWNLKDSIKDLLNQRGMSKGTDVLVAGCSAGAVAVSMLCDQIAGQLKPFGLKTKCLMDAGFIPDVKDYKGQFSLREKVGRMTQLQSFNGIGINGDCQQANPGQSWKCFFPQYNLKYIRTPTFLVNSLADYKGVALSLAPRSKKKSNPIIKCLSSNYDKAKCTPQQLALLQNYSQGIKSSLDEISHNRASANVQFKVFTYTQSTHCVMDCRPDQRYQPALHIARNRNAIHGSLTKSHSSALSFSHGPYSPPPHQPPFTTTYRPHMPLRGNHHVYTRPLINPTLPLLALALVASLAPFSVAALPGASGARGGPATTSLVLLPPSKYGARCLDGSYPPPALLPDRPALLFRPSLCSLLSPSVPLRPHRPSALSSPRSPPGFYHRQGHGAGANKWLIYLQGGGWCYSVTGCSFRATTVLGSTRFYLPPSNPAFESTLRKYGTQFSGMLSASAQENPAFFNWNTVMVLYCDGGGFAGSGQRIAVNRTTTLFSHGSRIINAVLQELTTRRGMAAAAKVVLSGCSAGGQAVSAVCNRVGAAVPRANVKCIMDGGFFLDADDVTGQKYFRSLAKSIVALHRPFVDPACRQMYGTQVWKCFFPQNNLYFVRPPVFIVNSVADFAAIDIANQGQNESSTTSITYCMNKLFLKAGAPPTAAAAAVSDSAPADAADAGAVGAVAAEFGPVGDEEEEAEAWGGDAVASSEQTRTARSTAFSSPAFPEASGAHANAGLVDGDTYDQFSGVFHTPQGVPSPHPRWSIEGDTHVQLVPFNPTTSTTGATSRSFTALHGATATITRFDHDRDRDRDNEGDRDSSKSRSKSSTSSSGSECSSAEMAAIQTYSRRSIMRIRAVLRAKPSFGFFLVGTIGHCTTIYPSWAQVARKKENLRQELTTWIGP